MESMQTEEWRSVVGWNGLYSVSDRGRIRNDRTQYILKPHRSPKNGKPGYCYAFLSNNGFRLRPLIHRLVADAFLGPRPDGHQVNHKDGDKANNDVRNLEYVTASQNVRHSFVVLGKQTNRFPGELSGNHRLTDARVREARQRYASGEACWRLSREFGVSNETLRRAILRTTWKHVA